MNFIAISGDGLFLCLLAISGIIVALIFGIRKYIQYQKKNIATDNQNLLERNKYALVNTFKMSGTLFNIGLLAALSMTILAFSWTTYDQKLKMEIPRFDGDGEIETVIDRTVHEKKPPPPPPAPVEIPEVIEPDDAAEEIEFVDLEIEEPEPVVAPSRPTVKKEVSVPTPPPLPAVKEPKIDDGVIFIAVEEMPRFPGCEDMTDKNARIVCAQKNMLEYIYKEINYPTIARETGIEGTVVVRFYVDEKGSIKEPEILKEIGGGCGKEALRVVQKMNDLPERWTPGRQRGKAVKVYFNLPVKYKLN